MIGLQRLEEFLCEPFLSAGCTVAVDDAVEREGVHARCGVLVDGAADDDVVEAAGLLLRVVEFVASAVLAGVPEPLGFVGLANEVLVRLEEAESLMVFVVFSDLLSHGNSLVGPTSMMH
mmetsp:Transcript_52555/g.163104  ORF Transcript_52555/g.163104 Transcript_52555/m.163104 type:complete len:119 (+) Transcript_52555:982-1338(+)